MASDIPVAVINDAQNDESQQLGIDRLNQLFLNIPVKSLGDLFSPEPDEVIPAFCSAAMDR